MFGSGFGRCGKDCGKLSRRNRTACAELFGSKINGQRAYKLARGGKIVEMPVRKVNIYELEILEYTYPELKIRCKVSSGTYIRALGEDIGKALKTGGYLTTLRRTEVGNYRVENALKLKV